MKFLSSINRPSSRAANSAFTLVEMMTTMFIFVTFLVAGMVAVQLFTLRVSNFTTDKLLAAGGGAKALDRICNKVRGAQSVQVGNFANNAFTTIGSGTNQQGNALKVFSTINSTPYTIFYLNTSTLNLYSVTNGQTVSTNSPGTLLASSITNNPCFWAENFQGTVYTVTNFLASGNNCSIQVKFQFKQYATYVKNLTNEFYTLQTRITPRSPNFQ